MQHAVHLSQSREARAAELAEQERETTRAERRLLAETLLGTVACCAASLFMVSWAVHTTNATWAGVSFWSGLLVGDAGIFVLLLRHYARSEES